MIYTCLCVCVFVFVSHLFHVFVFFLFCMFLLLFFEFVSSSSPTSTLLHYVYNIARLLCPLVLCVGVCEISHQLAISTPYLHGIHTSPGDFDSNGP